MSLKQNQTSVLPPKYKGMKEVIYEKEQACIAIRILYIAQESKITRQALDIHDVNTGTEGIKR